MSTDNTTPAPVSVARVSLTHRMSCADDPGHFATHLPPIGFYAGEAWNGEHGEPFDHGAPEQCMCGCPAYYACIDYLALWEVNPSCRAGDHEGCNREATHMYVDEPLAEMCPCGCHSVPLAEVIGRG